jgi:ribose 5-phosphate isomerase
MYLSLSPGGQKSPSQIYIILKAPVVTDNKNFIVDYIFLSSVS